MDGLTLPQNPWLWGVIAAGVVVVVLYALSRRGWKIFKFGFGGATLVVDRNRPGQERVTTVAKNIVVEGKVRKIAGSVGTDTGQGGPVDVATGAHIGSTGDVDEIVGREFSSDRSRHDRSSGS